MKKEYLREVLANIKRIQANEDTVTAFRAHDATIKKYEAALKRMELDETPVDELVTLLIDAERRADELRRQLFVTERSLHGAHQRINALEDGLEVLTGEDFTIKKIVFIGTAVAKHAERLGVVKYDKPPASIGEAAQRFGLKVRS